MKKNLVILLVAAMGFTSCEIIDSFLNPPAGGCVLIQTDFDIPNDPAKVTTKYTYNADNQLTEVLQEEFDMKPTPYINRFVFTYVGKEISTMNHYTKFYEDPEELEATYHFYYSSDKLDSVTQQNGEAYGNSRGYYLLDYSGDKLSRLSYYHIDQTSDQAILHRTIDLTWTGDNVTQTSSQYVNADPWVHTYTYDDKKAPLNHMGMSFTAYYDLTLLSKNNVTQSSLTQGSADPMVTDFELTYNAEDYLETRRDLRDWDTYPTTFTYRCD